MDVDVRGVPLGVGAVPYPTCRTSGEKTGVVLESPLRVSDGEVVLPIPVEVFPLLYWSKGFRLLSWRLLVDATREIPSSLST